MVELVPHTVFIHSHVSEQLLLNNLNISGTFQVIYLLCIWLHFQSILKPISFSFNTILVWNEQVLQKDNLFFILFYLLSL